MAIFVLNNPKFFKNFYFVSNVFLGNLGALFPEIVETFILG